MLVGQTGHATPSGGALDEAQLHEVGLVHVLNGDGLLADGGGQGVQTHGTSAVEADDGLHHAAVGVIQTQLVDLQAIQGVHGGLLVDLGLALHHGEVTDPLEQAVGDTGGTARAGGDLQGAVLGDGDLQDGGTALDDLGELLGGVQLQLEEHPEAVAERGGQLTRAGGGTDEGELGQINADGAGGGTLTDDDVQGEILHGGVEDLLHHAGQTVDLVNEEHVTGVEVGQKSRQISLLLDGGTRGHPQIHPHLGGDDPRQGGLTQAGRAVKENVVKRITALFCGFDIHLKVFLYFFLTYVFVKRLGAQREFHVRVGCRVGGIHNSVFKIEFVGIHSVSFLLSALHQTLE